MDEPAGKPEVNPYKAPQAVPTERRKSGTRIRILVVGIILVPVAVAIGGWTACNEAMNADNGDVIGSTIGGGLVAGVIATFLLFMIGSSRRSYGRDDSTPLATLGMM